MLAGSLHRRVAYPGRVALVVAHPDDETIAAGGSLHLLPDLLLVHVTDGAPRGLGDAERAGFANPADYAAARRSELHAALAVAGAAPTLVALDMPDQEASLHMAEVSARLAALFKTERVAAVLTHAYEGGHPDHDAVAFCAARAAGGREVVEFPAYHAAADGTLVTGRFLPPGAGLLPPPCGEGAPEGGGWGKQQALPPTMVSIPGANHRQGLRHPPTHPFGAPSPRGGGRRMVPLTPSERARKAAMLACFHTQRKFLSRFPTDAEAFRPAAPDFTQAPHPGPLNYERWGWPLDGARWRSLARCAA